MNAREKKTLRGTLAKGKRPHEVIFSIVEKEKGR